MTGIKGSDPPVDGGAAADREHPAADDGPRVTSAASSRVRRWCVAIAVLQTAIAVFGFVTSAEVRYAWLVVAITAVLNALLMPRLSLGIDADGVHRNGGLRAQDVPWSRVRAVEERARTSGVGPRMRIVTDEGRTVPIRPPDEGLHGEDARAAVAGTPSGTRSRCRCAEVADDPADERLEAPAAPDASPAAHRSSAQPMRCRVEAWRRWLSTALVPIQVTVLVGGSGSGITRLLAPVLLVMFLAQAAYNWRAALVVDTDGVTRVGVRTQVLRWVDVAEVRTFRNAVAARAGTGRWGVVAPVVVVGTNDEPIALDIPTLDRACVKALRRAVLLEARARGIPVTRSPGPRPGQSGHHGAGLPQWLTTTARGGVDAHVTTDNVDVDRYASFDTRVVPINDAVVTRDAGYALDAGR